MIYAFDDVTVTVQHVALDGVVAIGDRLAAGEFSARLDVHGRSGTASPANLKIAVPGKESGF